MSKKRKEFAKPTLVLTATHKPTYTILSYKHLTERNFKFRPSPFQTKREIQSIKSMTRLKNAINWLLMFADKKTVFRKSDRKRYSFKIAMITLTLPGLQLHSDDFIKQHMLQPFLYWLQRYYGALYVWKAESQLNGRIHFHINVDTFIPCKSIRIKWNKLLAKHSYCLVNPDGSNNKGDAATQIKAIRNAKEAAGDIASYMQHKDEPKAKQLKQLLNGDATVLDANVHCKFDPELSPDKQNPRWYKRVIDGRLWGCSEALSGINISIDEQFPEFQKEERIFFKQNPDIYNLGKKIILREKEKYKHMDESAKAVIRKTDEDIEHKFRFMENVFIHKHLSDMKKGATLQRLLHEQKMKMKQNNQKYFTEN